MMNERGMHREYPIVALSHLGWNCFDRRLRYLMSRLVARHPRSSWWRPSTSRAGPRTYGELPAYLAGWDVCLLPFALNDATRFLAPAQTLEYMAAERAIVSTAIPDVAEPCAEEEPGLACFAAGPPRLTFRRWETRPQEERTRMVVTLVFVGLAAGVLAGLFGVGGGILIVPALVLLADFPQKTALGTSLGALLLPVGLLGAYTYWQHGNLDVRASLLVALGLFFGAYGGARLAHVIPGPVLQRMFAVFMVLMAARLWYEAGGR